MKKNTNKPLRMQFTFDGHRYSVTGHTQSQLLERYNHKLKELQEGHYDSDTMLGKWIDTWLETYKEGKVSESIRTGSSLPGMNRIIQMSYCLISQSLRLIS